MMPDTIKKYTDEDHTLKIKGFDFGVVDADGVIITFEQRGDEIFRVTDVTIVSKDTIQFRTTQEQTGKLQTAFPAFIHFNWWQGGLRHAVDEPLQLTVLDNQPSEEMRHEHV